MTFFFFFFFLTVRVRRCVRVVTRIAIVANPNGTESDSEWDGKVFTLHTNS